jgi:hypothetical protein
MLLSLTPVVYRGSHQKWIIGALLHILGGTLGGLAVGALLVPLTLLPFSTPLRLIVGICIALAALGDLGLTRQLYPSPRRQVPESWRKLVPGHPAFFLYGLGLGTALFTRTVSVALYAAVAIAITIGRPINAVIILASFGLARACFAVLPSAVLYPQERAGDLLRMLGRHTGLATNVGGALATFLAGNFIGMLMS